MGEHHGVDEPDPLGDPGGGEIGQSGQHARPEEDRAGGGERETEALEQPERQQGIDDQTAREGIETEQGCEREHDAA